MRGNPLSIRVNASQGRTIISTDDSIWVHARNQFEDEVRQQQRYFGDKSVYEPVVNKTRVGLAGVHSRRDENHFALPRIPVTIGVWVGSGHC